MDIIITFLYIIFGALPVTFWVLWSPFYLVSMKLEFFIIGVAMVLGTLGIYLTFSFTNTNIKYRVNVCLLLFLGQLAMLFAIYGFDMFKRIPRNTQDIMFYYGTCGPLLVALHYQITFIYNTAFNKGLWRQ